VKHTSKVLCNGEVEAQRRRWIFYETLKIAGNIPHSKDGFSESINDAFAESRQNMISRLEK